MLQLLEFDGAADAKSDWYDWPGGLLQAEAAGTWGGATLTMQRTFADVSGQAEPDAADLLDVAALTENGATDEVVRGRGGKVRLVKTGGDGTTALRGVWGRSAHSRVDGSRSPSAAT